VCKILDTSVLLHANDGDKTCILKAVKRNILLLPAMPIIPFSGILLNQGTLYYLCGKWNDGRATRLAEYLTGFILGALV